MGSREQLATETIEAGFLQVRVISIYIGLTRIFNYLILLMTNLTDDYFKKWSW